MNAAAKSVTVEISAFSYILDAMETRREVWARGDLGKGGYPTVISPAGDVCTVTHEGRVFVGAIRRQLGLKGVSGEGVRVVS